MDGAQHGGGGERRAGARGRVRERMSSCSAIVRLSSRRLTACQAPTNTYPALGPVAARHSSRASTCWMDCRTRSSSACRAVWSAAAMLPRQPCSRSGAWHTGAHPGHGEAGCTRFDHQVGQTCMSYLHVDAWLHQVRACAPAVTAST